MRRRQGLSLGEVLMSLALLSVIVVTALLVLQWSLQGSRTQQGKTIAAFLAQRQMESLLAEDHPTTGKGDFTSPYEGYHWAASVQEIADEPFLAVDLLVQGPGGIRYTLHTQRCKDRRSFVYRSGPKLLQTEEDIHEDRLVAENFPYPDFALTPDGQSLLFSQLVDGKPQLYSMPFRESGPATLLASHPEGIREARPSPDGFKIAFTSQENGHSQVFVWDRAARTFVNVSKSQSHDGSPCWMPDSQGLVVCREGNELVLLEGGSQTTLVHIEEGWLATPEVSADGKHLLFISSAGGNPDLYTMEMTSKQPKVLVEGPQAEENPHFSRDGKRILYSSRGDDGVSHLYSMNLDGSALTPLLEGQPGDDPQWAP